MLATTRHLQCALLVALLSRLAAADAHLPPCAKCTLDVPTRTDTAVPLLVVLHGDRDHAANTASRWRAAARAKGWALLALECPAAEGCKDSWWKWNGDPAWIAARVADVANSVAIDPKRVYLAGWSGGATYIGMQARAWPATFAAVVIWGGGMAPDGDDCPAAPLPAYFLVGDANPLHGLAKDLRAWFEACKQEVSWNLVPRGDHDKESRALTVARAKDVLDWLAARPRR